MCVHLQKGCLDLSPAEALRKFQRKTVQSAFARNGETSRHNLIGMTGSAGGKRSSGGDDSDCAQQRTQAPGVTERCASDANLLTGQSMTICNRSLTVNKRINK